MQLVDDRFLSLFLDILDLSGDGLVLNCRLFGLRRIGIEVGEPNGAESERSRDDFLQCSHKLFVIIIVRRTIISLRKNVQGRGILFRCSISFSLLSLLGSFLFSSGGHSSNSSVFSSLGNESFSVRHFLSLVIGFIASLLGQGANFSADVG